ncbi:uveal autoantigen with coiled-coil domains and ankyrin repeats-like [Drosophila bipectinata]|uniref:uveal autoantigen with coiled-coil domains and ankyrin repeats-like n=1 Tax=Drosophila bipectinata TaxID=42026 RepID=UPI001C8A3E7A|nr:uncharacterized protein LOC108130329 [Drosophila bipectinata]
MPPCTLRQRGLAYRPRRDKNREKDVLAPKPVHPRSLRFHGFFGISYVNQHVMVDERWTPNSLTEQFKGMTDLLTRRLVFKNHESKANRQRYFRENKRLKLQCRDGRTKLQNILVNDNTHKIRNFLINHKDMQRLYQKMPIHLVVDNINQRTFVMRKERDRLEFRLGQLKKHYKEQLLQRAMLQNRIKYQNEFILDEELKSRIFLKKIENSNVRLKAIKTINNTYKKMIQVLVHDEIFYEPILRSLSSDMEDQANFIKHILYLGMPAIAKFKELNDEFRNMEEKSRKNLQAKLQMLASLKKPGGTSIITFNKPKEAAPTTNLKRYVRETQSMMILKLELKAVEKTIKEVKFVTLCSQAKEIYPRMKSQVDNNDKLHRMIVNDMLAHEMLETKMKCASVLKGVLVNNLSEEEINRLERIKDLKKTLEKDTEFEKDTLQHLKNRADAYVMLRVSIWNLLEILRHVDRQPKLLRAQYPNSYLKLPLLKFEMLNMRAAAPEIFEENIDNIMHMVKRKIYKLMKAYTVELKPATIKRNVEEYHADFLASLDMYEPVDADEPPPTAPEDDILQENKTMANVPNRKQIKAQSAKLIEELAKQNE